MLKKTILIALLCSAAIFITPNEILAQTRYSGSHHTTTHGGHYSRGSGSSHKGGSYKNSRTANHYGKHKS